MELYVCPSTLAEGYSTYSPKALRQLFGEKEVSPFLDLDFEKDVHREEVANNMKRVSVSGAQEKMSAIVENGKLRLTDKTEISTHLLKPAPLDYGLKVRKMIPANEHLTMQIASQVYGILTAANGLCFDKKCRPIYVTKRFDILSDGSKTQMEDLAAIIGRNEQTDGKYYKYEGCYQEIAESIKSHVPSWPVAIERFFQLLVFNYIYANGDAHMKNFSIQILNNECILAPAYDLMNTSLHLDGDDLGLQGGLFRSGWRSEVYERTGHPCRTDYEEFGRIIGIPASRIKRIITQFQTIPQEAISLISRSFLDDKSKRSYLRIISERTARFCRQSEI